MFNWFKKEEKITTNEVMMFSYGTREACFDLKKRIELLEDHIGVEYFNGGKNKPHYRAKRSPRGSKISSELIPTK